MGRSGTSKSTFLSVRSILLFGGIAAATIFLVHQLVFSGAGSFGKVPLKWTPPKSFRQRLLRSGSNVKQRPPIQHPIPNLMQQAEVNFQEKLDRQSKTLEGAVTEYRRRYERDPPAGFDDWFQFSMDNKVEIIDEYDQLMKDLTPWFSFSGAEIRRRAVQVGYLPSVDLVRIKDGQTRTIDVNKGFEDSEVGARAKGFRVMLEKFQDKLPDMDFPINEKAEGRILVPWEENLYFNLTADSRGE